MGGRVAFEMACQLEQAGQQVHLIVFDTDAPHKLEEPMPEANQVTAFAGLLGLLFGQPFETNPKEFEGMRLETALESVIDRAHEMGMIPQGFERSRLHSFYRVFHANMLAHRAYEGSTYGGPITLFRANDNPRAEEALGWQEFLGRKITQETVPGSHHTIFDKPHLADLATCLNSWLAHLP